MKHHLVRLGVFMACTMIPTSGLANGGGYMRGVKSIGAFQPIGIDQVEMVSEKLEIDLHIEFAEIRVEYVLHNPGPPVTIEAGFPSAIASDVRHQSGDDGSTKVSVSPPTLEGFELSADGKKVSVLQKMDDFNLTEEGLVDGAVVKSWHTFSLDFKAGQSRTLTARYRNPYFGTFDYISDDSRISPLRFTYLFSAAGLWRGSIREGTVMIRNVSLPESQIQLSHPKRFTRVEGGWVWQFQDFEPTLEDDLTIVTRSPYFERGLWQDALTDDDGESRAVDAYVAQGVDIYASDDRLDSGRWELHRHTYDVTASSTLRAGKTSSYKATHLRDYERETAWVEGVEGDGKGETLTFRLDKPVPVSRIGIVNGYAKSPEIYKANGRVREFAIAVNGETRGTVTIPDELLNEERFFFDIPGTLEPVSELTLTITDVYPGTKYQDTAVSEIVLVTPLSKPPKIQPAR